MPIHCPIKIRTLSAEVFAERDYLVMGQAYACQNEIGRFCDESLYEAALKSRLLACGFKEIYTQVPITVTHRDFEKAYRLDLLADHALYELKTAAALCGDFEAQILNYILLLGIKRGKLLNFRPAKVEGKIVATSLSLQDRRQYQLDCQRWRELCPACGFLRDCLIALLNDWGAFLDLDLYKEALVHFIGGEQHCVQSIPISCRKQVLGEQKFIICSPGVAMKISAFTSGLKHHEAHLQRLLALTPLTAMQWINLNHSKISIVTLSK